MKVLGQLVSLNIALPVTVLHGSKEITTGIFKKPSNRAHHLGPMGLDGDGQADLIYHGGEDKAVCVYSSEHFPYWSDLWGEEVAPGAFGENFTVSHITEQMICIGDILQVGSAIVQVSQPRQPCFKLGLKHNKPQLPLHVQQTGLTGFYLRVLQEGSVKEGDDLLLTSLHPKGVSVAEANHIMYTGKKETEGMLKLLDLEELAVSWREMISRRLADAQAADEGREDVRP
ncbi:MOSC domain-containing protein [Paenibacillus nasutitermitis]|uniref:MOSC domain-containing protein n=1 Tax=Paenibacillus nasutitermitis TaxID=1652958 RepID=A0A916YVE9_9BACL|nr:MOSC domain-containing protein [Paenibacillus nasutitermitis]GGD63582.1 MOSC domain-containing protein [Paenibacillus nasutitermitis]